jgi:hypothetical protein
MASHHAARGTARLWRAAHFTTGGLQRPADRANAGQPARYRYHTSGDQRSNERASQHPDGRAGADECPDGRAGANQRPNRGGRTGRRSD